MITDLDEALAGTKPYAEAAVTVVSKVRRHRRHRWTLHYENTELGTSEDACECGVIRDVTRSRRGTSARRLGHDQERRIERVYGPRKVGEYGDAIDLIGRDFVWQSKATRHPIPAWAALVRDIENRVPPLLVTQAARAMYPLRAHRSVLVIQSWVANGLPTRDLLWVYAADWRRLHGGAPFEGWVVMSGSYFLETHGRDE